MSEPLKRRVAAIAALDDPTRRRLYEHVARQTEPVSRDEAAAAVGAARSTAAFHLDRLVEEGLLEASYHRRTGRSGPGAGRPAKLYARSPRQVTVSLPERRYELAALLMAAAIDDSEATTRPPHATLRHGALRAGRELGEAARTQHHGLDAEQLVWAALECYGFEPRTEGRTVALANCPFHALAELHPALVCDMNLSLLTGLLDELGYRALAAELDPAPGRCCVRLSPPPAGESR